MVRISPMGIARALVLSIERARGWAPARRAPLRMGLRFASNRVVPWAARAAFRPGVHEVHGVRLEIPCAPGLGAGGEFHMALGTYEHVELAYVAARLRPGDTFLDIGAHIGYFALPAAKRVGPRGRVIAVEPHPRSAATLRRNVARNGYGWITVVEAAAAEHDGTAPLTLSRDSAMWSTLLQGTLDHEAEALPVRTRSLDSLVAEAGWPPLAGLKMDVEGAEAAVLRGGRECLTRNPGAFVVFEVSGGNDERVRASQTTLRWFQAQGYRFRVLTRNAAGAFLSAEDVAHRLDAPDWQDFLFNVAAEKA